MNYDDKLKSLLRERQLAERKKLPVNFILGPGKVGFWSKILAGRRQYEVLAAKERWGNLLLNSLNPPPQTDEEQRLSDQNRSLAQIDAEIAAIPPVSVDRHDYAPNSLPSVDGRVIVMRRIKKVPSPYSYEPKFQDKFEITTYPYVHDGLAAALGLVAANRQTSLSIDEDGRMFPMRSHFSFTEEQNHDQAIRADVGGRHFRLKLVLSKPLFSALVECLPDPEKRRTHQ